MKCQICGRELKNGARFCIACGAQHDANGQLVGGNQGKVDYNKTVMVSDNNGNVDYNKTMMVGSTGFKQYQGNQNQQNYQQQQQYNYSGASYNQNQNNYNAVPPKKKLSPIIIICPIIIIASLAYMFLGKNKNTAPTETVAPIEVVETQAPVATVAEITESTQVPIVGGYWSADGESFYIDNVKQTNRWILDTYYVGSDGKKYVSRWDDEGKFYLDQTGKKAKNQWIEFPYTDKNGKNKTGLYYVDGEGNKVKDKTVDGRYINSEGCYWPSSDDFIQTGDKGSKVEDNDKSETKKESEVSEEDKKKTLTNETSATKESVKATTAATTQPTTQATTIPTTVAINQNTAQNIVPAEVNNVASNGTSVAYQIIKEKYLNEGITNYDKIVLNDAKYPELSYVVNTWNNNERSRNGVQSGGSPNSQSLTSTSTLEIARNDGKIFSLCETITYYDNNKAYEKNRLGKVWDARTGEVLELSEIFNDGKYDTFLDKVNKKLESSKYDVLKNLSSDDLLDICEWYMTNVGITLVFNASEIDFDEESNSINGVTVPLTYADSGSGVNKLLKQNYKK